MECSLQPLLLQESKRSFPRTLQDFLCGIPEVAGRGVNVAQMLGGRVGDDAVDEGRRAAEDEVEFPEIPGFCSCRKLREIEMVVETVRGRQKAEGRRHLGRADTFWREPFAESLLVVEQCVHRCLREHLCEDASDAFRAAAPCEEFMNDGNFHLAYCSVFLFSGCLTFRTMPMFWVSSSGVEQ